MPFIWKVNAWTLHGLEHWEYGDVKGATPYLSDACYDFTPGWEESVPNSASDIKTILTADNSLPLASVLKVLYIQLPKENAEIWVLIATKSHP